MRIPVQAVLICAFLAPLACDSPVQPSSTSNRGIQIRAAVADRRGYSARGVGHYLLQGTWDVKFEFAAESGNGDHANGEFRQSTTFDNGTMDISARVTCLAVDAVNGRAWIGGVVKENRSTSPDYQVPITAPGQDVWFRVLDARDVPGAVDRSTFLGFVGSFPSSAAYCAQQPWADGNARTHPVTTGEIEVVP